ncbi:hypothetical protein K488DRAFT_68724 [Vararia minispora EC-137]|uniref:Uncharacterized protein n=1 Tax=Vararia minispora EC-137 TaxID=1314806 RepID=A0ACB8QTT1_9AGAM|nr:hypothetical protein K488DRAFT_68724 [Vararia minispora EC-137]
MADGLSMLQTDVLHSIAAYAHSTDDILALAATARTPYEAFLFPGIFRRRIYRSGWDFNRWAADAPSEFVSESLLQCSLRYWRRVAVLHDRARDLLDEAQSGFVYAQEVTTGFQLWYPRWTFPDWPTPLFDAGADVYPSVDPLRDGHIDLIDGERAFGWLLRFGYVLGQLLAHDDSRNVAKLLEPAHDKTWLTTLRVLLGTIYDRPLPAAPRAMPDVLTHAVRLSRAANAFMLLVLAAPTLTLFLPAAPYLWEATLTRSSLATHITFVHARLFSPDTPLAPADADTPAHITLERRRAACAVTVVVLYLLLHLYRVPSDSLPPPTLPHGVLALTALPTDTDLTHDAGLAGTPLQALFDLGPGTTQDWAGYYVYARRPESHARDPPMFLTLSIPYTPAEPGTVLFTGHGSDLHGEFLLTGRAATRTGAFRAHKAYTAGHAFDWCGVVGTAGIAGFWGTEEYGGMLWLWPRAWSRE